MSELPKGWVEAELGELGAWHGGGTPSKSNPDYWTEGNIPWVSPKDMKTSRISDAEDHITQEAVNGSATNLVPEGAVLLVTRSGILKHSLPVAVTGREVAINQDIKALVPDTPLESEFIARQIRNKTSFVLRHCTKAGTTVDSIDFQRLKAVRVCLPPLAEQKRIVAKLDALGARSARARKELERIDTLVARYKQAVLSKAFSGELLGLPSQQTELPNERCWDIPGGWKWVLFSDVVQIASNLVKPEKIWGLPHIAPDNIKRGEAKLLPFNTIGQDGVISPKHHFFPGQILYSKIRPYLRKAVLVDFEGGCSADMYPLTASEKIVPRYLLSWLVSEDFTWFATQHQGRTVLPKINQKALNQTPLPLPPLPEQREIVRRIESAFGKIDRLAGEAKRALALVGRLDEAVLAKAFRGELVPQDPNDEPASVLLERIRAERAAAPKPQRGRKAVQTDVQAEAGQ